MIMDLKEEERGHVLIVALGNRRLDAALAVRFKERLVGLIEGGRAKIVVDLSLVEFIDSSGLGALVSLLKRIGRGGEIAICGLQTPVATMFRATRMDKVFQISGSVDEAVETLAA
jgi:anti-sigma B factor antagonist